MDFAKGPLKLNRSANELTYIYLLLLFSFLFCCRPIFFLFRERDDINLSSQQ